MKSIIASLVLVIGSTIIARHSFAQEIDVRVATESAPHYVGVPVVVQLTVGGLEPRPEPTCEFEPSSNAVRGSLAGISPRVFQRVTRSGNQVQRVTEVTYTIQFIVTANEPGRHKVGPFRITQGGRSEQVAAVEMEFQEVPETDDMRVVLDMPSAAYPDQQVPVAIEWWFAGKVDDVNELNIDATTLDRFQFLPDDQPVRGESRLPIQTGKGTITLGANAESRTDNGKQFTVVRAERTLVPDRIGSYELAPLSATIELVTEWQSRRGPSMGGFGGSLFEEAFGGGRRPEKMELFRAEGNSTTFQVKPFPVQGKPESFSGGVGKGFSVDVVADRTVVRVGDPIRLTVKLRGQGNIEGATLPDLSADDGLDPERFRLPEGDVSGVLQDDGKSKHFLVSVRVLDEGISEIPSIAYSWFDAEKESYQTTRSKPIALRVMEAQVVGADSVVSSSPSTNAPTLSAESGNPNVPSEAPSFTLTGADLAIENDPTQLLSYSGGLLGQRSFQLTGYAVGSLCVVVALVDRRRRRRDPAAREARGNLKRMESQIESAAKSNEKEAAKRIAATLQSILAEYPEANRAGFQRVIADCETIAYRPDGGNESVIETEIVGRASDLITELKREIGGA